VSPEQVVVAVVYGQQVPEDRYPPPAEAAPAGAAEFAGETAGGSVQEAGPSGGRGRDGSSSDVSPLDGVSPAAGVPAAEGVPADADLVVVAEESGGFTVRLDNFTGPFDLLLQLIGKHKLDVTEVALHQVTDDFIAYIRAMGDDWDLGEASEFLLVAATLLDLKAARLLPAAEVEDEEDLALLEARDLLFARLLQYKAYKEAAAYLSDLESTGAKRYPRDVAMEPRYAEALPDLVLGIGVERLFKLALKQFTPKPGPPQVSIAHIHQVRVSVREHAALLRDRLRRAGSATFSLLVADCENTLEVVARFLALLELYREGLIEFEQPVSLDELTVRWIGGDALADDLDIDDYEGTRVDPDATPPAESVTEADLKAIGIATLSPDDEADDDEADDDEADEDDDDDLDLDEFEVADLELDVPVAVADAGVADAAVVDAAAGSDQAAVAVAGLGEVEAAGSAEVEAAGLGKVEATSLEEVEAARSEEVAVAGSGPAVDGDISAGQDEAGAVSEQRDEPDDGGWVSGPEGTSGAVPSGAALPGAAPSGEVPSGADDGGTVDAPGGRRANGGDDEDAATAAVEERQ
jgi:segregation and condensation protein A